MEDEVNFYSEPQYYEYDSQGQDTWNGGTQTPDYGLGDQTGGSGGTGTEGNGDPGGEIVPPDTGGDLGGGNTGGDFGGTGGGESGGNDAGAGQEMTE